MGGRALKTFTRIYERNEFDILSIELTKILKQDFNKVAIPLFYNNKKSFGDIDILVSTDGFIYDMREYIIGTFNPAEIFHNGNCWSFDYKEIQVDIITSSSEHFNSMLDYLSHNDKGNLIGRLAQHKGLKYGDIGLWYEHYFKGINLGKIILSKDIRKIYAYLDLDYDRNLKGFDELTDIFEFISKSKYFDSRLYQLKNLNKVNRERNLKRKNYMMFLKWIDENIKDGESANEEMFNRFSLEDLISNFPEANLEMEIRRLEYKYCKNLYIKSKFNGAEVMRRFNINGKALGVVIDGFRKEINSNYHMGYDAFILNNTIDTIYSTFDSYLNLNGYL